MDGRHAPGAARSKTGTQSAVHTRSKAIRARADRCVGLRPLTREDHGALAGRFGALDAAPGSCGGQWGREQLESGNRTRGIIQMRRGPIRGRRGRNDVAGLYCSSPADEANQTYKTALEVFRGYVPTEQALGPGPAHATVHGGREGGCRRPRLPPQSGSRAQAGSSRRRERREQGRPLSVLEEGCGARAGGLQGGILARVSGLRTARRGWRWDDDPSPLQGTSLNLWAALRSGGEGRRRRKRLVLLRAVSRSEREHDHEAEQRQQTIPS